MRMVSVAMGLRFQDFWCITAPPRRNAFLPIFFSYGRDAHGMVMHFKSGIPLLFLFLVTQRQALLSLFLLS